MPNKLLVAKDFFRRPWRDHHHSQHQIRARLGTWSAPMILKKSVLGVKVPTALFWLGG